MEQDFAAEANPSTPIRSGVACQTPAFIDEATCVSAISEMTFRSSTPAEEASGDPASADKDIRASTLSEKVGCSPGADDPSAPAPISEAPPVLTEAVSSMTTTPASTEETNRRSVPPEAPSRTPAPEAGVPCTSAPCNAAYHSPASAEVAEHFSNVTILHGTSGCYPEGCPTPAVLYMEKSDSKTEVDGAPCEDAPPTESPVPPVVTELLVLEETLLLLADSSAPAEGPLHARALTGAAYNTPALVEAVPSTITSAPLSAIPLPLAPHDFADKELKGRQLTAGNMPPVVPILQDRLFSFVIPSAVRMVNPPSRLAFCC